MQNLKLVLEKAAFATIKNKLGTKGIATNGARFATGDLLLVVRPGAPSSDALCS